MTIVLVRQTLRSAITRVETSEKGIGLMGFVVSPLIPLEAVLTIQGNKAVGLLRHTKLIPGSCRPSESTRYRIGLCQLPYVASYSP
jgi:hypothetical protein